MVSQGVVIPSWRMSVFFLLVALVAGAHAATATPNNGTETNSGNATDTTSNTTTTAITTSTTASIRPDFVVETLGGRPCIVAMLNISMKISYAVAGKKGDDNTVAAFKDIVVPSNADISVASVCGENVSNLILEWDNSTFSLNLTFVTLGSTRKHLQPTNWTLDDIVLGYNLSDKVTFPGASDDEYMSINKSRLGLYTTTIGHTQQCEQAVKVELGKEDNGAELTFSFVKIAAFNMTVAQFPEKVDGCIIKSTSVKDEDIVVPLIIACSLSLVVVIVVIAYAISRKVQEARDQTQYKPMP